MCVSLIHLVDNEGKEMGEGYVEVGKMGRWSSHLLHLDLYVHFRFL